ncbi:MAG: hypothetical protein ACREKS_12880 [Candidatus Rokuibacteriota bacterium]
MTKDRAKVGGVVRQGSFLAVVAESEWAAAVKAARQLKATWTKWEGLPDQSMLWEHVRSTKVAKDDVAVNQGNPQAAIAGAAKKLKATYDFAVHTHGSMGPSCAVADVKDGRAEICPRRRRTSYVARSRPPSRWTRKTCTSSTSTAPAATAGTATRTRRAMPRSSPR